MMGATGYQRIFKGFGLFFPFYVVLANLLLFSLTLVKGADSKFNRVRTRSAPAARQLAGEASGELSHQD